MNKVFISYSSQDEAFVRQMYNDLKRDGVECFFAKESIEWGDNWVLELEKALNQCQFIIFILTPDFCNSYWTQKERTTTLASLSETQKKKLLPLLLKKCTEDFPLFLKDIQYLDITTPEKYTTNYPKILKKLGGTPVTPQKPLDRHVLPPITSLPALSRVPYPSLGDCFVGRVADLWAIYDGLNNNQTAVIQGVGLLIGLGGLGKTQLALEYAWRFGHNYPGGVFWIEAELGPLTMVTQIANSAKLEIDHSLNEQEQLLQLWQHLHGAPVLIVLDNFPEDEPLQKWLPNQKTIFLLVTTRRRDFSRYFSLELNTLNDCESLKLLNTGKRQFTAAEAQPFIKVLDGLPLALELARHFLNIRPDLSMAVVLAELQKKGEMETLSYFTRHYGDEMPTGHVKEVAAMFRMVWETLPPFEHQLLQVMASLAPMVSVPRRLLKAIFQDPEEKEKEGNGLANPLDEGIYHLNITLSLLELDAELDPRMHRLLSAFVRSVAPMEQTWNQRVATAIKKEMARVADDYDTASLVELEKVLPHAESVLVWSGLDAAQVVVIANYMGGHHWKLGRYRLGERYWRKALTLARDHYAAGAPEIATQQANLALVLQALGELPEARELLQEALATDKKSFPTGHPAIAIDQANLALVLKDLGELPEARELLQEALATDKKSFPPGHPAIATLQANLALVLKDLGELPEARELLQEALAAAKKSFPTGHPTIAIYQANLASVLQDLGELPEARELLQEALATDKKSFPTGHPTIAIDQANLALVLANMGEFPVAIPLLTQALDSFLQTLGPEHPNTKTVKSHLERVKNRQAGHD